MCIICGMSDFKVYLAPMDGVTDAPLREILCRHGGYDWCFSEFLRVTDDPLSEKSLLHDVPELLSGGRTPDGTPLKVQLLGDNPAAMAKSAILAVRQGALGIDLNFGCPSRFVHHSGSMLLKEPKLLYEITSTVRDAVADKVPLSVKIRSGFAFKTELPKIVEAVACEGVSEITIHCRTRRELYRKEDLDWTVIAPLHERYPHVTFVANGEINSLEDALECSKQSGCSVFMSGRGGLMVPNMGHTIKGSAGPYNNKQILVVLREVFLKFIEMKVEDRVVLARAKQFAGYARRDNEYMTEFFKGFCRCNDIDRGLDIIDKAIEEFLNESK